MESTTNTNHLQAMPVVKTIIEMVLLTDWQTGTGVSQASKVYQTPIKFNIQTRRRVFKQHHQLFRKVQTHMDPAARHRNLSYMIQGVLFLSSIPEFVEKTHTSVERWLHYLATGDLSRQIFRITQLFFPRPPWSQLPGSGGIWNNYFRLQTIDENILHWQG